MTQESNRLPKKYILNSAVITTPGLYSYELIDTKEAQKWLAESNFESTIGYQETCDALETISGVKVNCNRKQIQMQVGDESLVFRLTCRLTDPELKGKIKDLDFILANSEIGLLRKEAEACFLMEVV